MINDPSVKKIDEINVVGTVLNEGSEVHLSTGKLGISQSAQKVQLPQIKSLNPLQMPSGNAQSSANLMQKSKWTKDGNLINGVMSQPISAKHLIS